MRYKVSFVFSRWLPDFREGCGQLLSLFFYILLLHLQPLWTPLRLEFKGRGKRRIRKGLT